MFIKSWTIMSHPEPPIAASIEASSSRWVFGHSPHITMPCFFHMVYVSRQCLEDRTRACLRKPQLMPPVSPLALYKNTHRIQ